MRTITQVLLVACILGLPVRAEEGMAVRGDAAPPEEARIRIEMFSERGCDVCERLRREVIPEFEFRYAGGYDWREYDISVPANYRRLVQWLRQLAVKGNPPVLVVVDGREALAGYEAIRDGMSGAMERAMAARLAGAGPPEAPADGPGSVSRHVAGFTLAGILSAAFVDSINPCMVAMMVFFLSLLSVSHAGVRRMALAGSAFVLACYVTYFVLGAGLFSGLRTLTAVQWIRRVVDGFLILLLVFFSLFSFLDAVRYHRTGKSRSVLLKLPDRLQRRIHEVIRRGLHTPRLVAGGFGVGVVVTLMESLCTGQVYLPALAFMIRSGQSTGRCMGYLAVYNLIFVLPLAVLLGLTCAGIGTPVLVEWSRRNVVFSKVLLGLFFAGMAAMMHLLR